MGKALCIIFSSRLSTTMKLLVVASTLSSAHALMLNAAPNAQQVVACSRSSSVVMQEWERPDFVGGPGLRAPKAKEWTAAQKKSSRSSLYGDIDVEEEVEEEP